MPTKAFVLGRIRSFAQESRAWSLALLAFAECAFAVWLYYPGLMTRDSQVQLQEARRFALTDFHPPITAFVWHFVDRIYPGPLGMLLLIDVLYFSGLAWCIARLNWSVKAKLTALLLIGLYPPIFVIIGTIWKDVLMQAALVHGFALGLLYLKRRSHWLLLPMALDFALGIAARHNAIGAALPLLALLIGVCLPARFRRWPRFALALAAAALCAFALRTAVGALTAPFTTKVQYWTTVPIFDLAGTSVHAKEVLFKPESGVMREGTRLSDIERVYSPYEHLYLYKCKGRHCKPVFDTTTDPQQMKSLVENWLTVIAHHPGAYLAHRAAVIGLLIGVDNDPRGILGGADLRVPRAPSDWRARAALLRRLHDLGPSLPFKVYLYLLLDAALLVVGAYLALARGAPLTLCWASSGWIYMLTVMFSTGAPDYRYSVWSILTTLLAGASALAVFFPSGRAPATEPR